MRDLTLRGEFPRAHLSTLQLRGVEEVREQFSRIIRKHQVIDHAPGRGLSELHYAPLTNMAVSSARLATSMLVEAQADEDACLLICALDESFSMVIGDRQVRVSAESCGIVPPGVPFRLNAIAGPRSLMLDIDREYLESAITRKTGLTPAAGLNFFQSTEYSATCVRRTVVELLRLLYTQMLRGAPELRHAYYQANLQELLITALLFDLETTLSTDTLHGHESTGLPRCVETAMHFMRTHADEVITTKTLAAVCAASQRSLARGFRKYCHTTPMAYLREIRLEHVHSELQESCPEDSSVTAIAGKWGFHNAGRFARQYRERYGHNPLQTLKQAPTGLQVVSLASPVKYN